MSFDMLAWLIAPSEGQAGFAPHRDRQPSDVRGSFHPDGSPKYCTAWSVLLLTVAPPTLALSLALSLALALSLTRVALGDADAETSCLYLIPRGVDPGYDAGDDATEVRLYGVSRPLLPFWPPSFCTPHAYPTLPALPSSLLPTLLLSSTAPSPSPPTPPSPGRRGPSGGAAALRQRRAVDPRVPPPRGRRGPLLAPRDALGLARPPAVHHAAPLRTRTRTRTPTPTPTPTLTLTLTLTGACCSTARPSAARACHGTRING